VSACAPLQRRLRTPVSRAFDTSSINSRGASSSSSASASRRRTPSAGSAGSASGAIQSTTTLASTTVTVARVRSRFTIADHEVGSAGEARDLASIVTELTETVRPLLQVYGRAIGAARRDRRQLGPIEKQAIALPPSSYSARPDPPSNRLRMTVEHPRCISHGDLLGVLAIGLPPLYYNIRASVVVVGLVRAESSRFGTRKDVDTCRHFELWRDPDSNRGHHDFQGRRPRSGGQE
jgi:hypothetical protein